MLVPRKLCVPRPPGPLLARPRLIAAEPAPLTVIHGAAGHGKTTLATQIAAAWHGTMAWLTLDQLDNDPRRWWMHLLAAVGHAAGGLAVSSSPLAEGAPLDDALVLAEALTGLAQAPSPVMLVMDDVHHLSAPAVLDALHLLLDALPLGVHVLLVSRRCDPLRLAYRATRADVHRIGPEALAFNEEELAAWGLASARDAHEASTACPRGDTGGWPAALGLRRQAQPVMDDYVAHEVIAPWSPAMQRWVRVAALLGHWSAPLLDHVLERADSPAMLASLRAQGCFVQAASGAGTGLCLIAVLRDSVNRTSHWAGGEREHLLGRAACWHEAAGQIEEAWRLRIQLSDWSAAAQLLERQGPDWLRQGEHDRLRAWLDQLPPTLVHDRPRLLYLRVWLMSDADKHRHARPLLQHIMALARQQPTLRDDHALMCGTHALMAVVERLHGHWAAMHEAARLSLWHAEAGGLDTRWRPHLTLGAVQFIQGELAGAAAALMQARKYAIIEGHHQGLALSTGYLCEALYQMGELDNAERVARHTQAQLSGTPFATSPLGPWRHIGLPDILRERGETAQASELLAQLAGLGRHGHAERLMSLFVLIRRWTLSLTQGAHAQAERLIDEMDALQVGMRFDASFPIGTIAAMRAQVRLQRGDDTHTRLWLEGLSMDWPAPDFGNHQDMLTAVRALLALARPRDAVDLVGPLLETARAGGWRVAQGQALLLRGIGRHVLGQARGAQDDLAASLALLHARGYRSVFHHEQAWLSRWPRLAGTAAWLAPAVPAADQRLEPAPAVAASRAAAPPPTVTPLSPREVELLHSVRRGLSDKQISAQLSISTGTVKTHLRNIFKKLGARNRVHALALYGQTRADAP